MAKEQIIELKEILKMIKKRFYIIVVVTILALLAAGIYSYRIAKPVYEAKTRIIIGNAIDPEGTKFQINDVAVYQRHLKTYSTIVKTSVVGERTVEKLKLNISPEGLLGNISATPQADTQFMDLKIRWSDPEQAVVILSTLSEVFIEEATSIYPGVTIKVMDKIKIPQYPVSPDKRRNMSLAFLIGIVASIGLILILDYLDNTVKTAEEVEDYLELSVIGAIPKEKEKIERIVPRVLKKSHHALMESYRTLRTNIDFMASCNNIKTILVTSSVPGEGKTTTASMLAAVMATAGKKTLLIDCDLRKAKIHKMLDLPNVIGISNMLAGQAEWAEAMYNTEIENLYVIPAGIRPPNPSELLSSAKMKDTINLLKEKFNYIIFDTPPVGVVTDAQILSQIVDGCILVVSSGETEFQNSAKAKGLLQCVNARILGVSLNKLKESDSYYYYNGYYGNDDKKRRKRRKRSFFGKKKSVSLD